MDRTALNYFDSLETTNFEVAPDALSLPWTFLIEFYKPVIPYIILVEYADDDINEITHEWSFPIYSDKYASSASKDTNYAET